MTDPRAIPWTLKQKRVLARVAGVTLDVVEQVLASLPPEDEWVMVDPA